MPEEKNRQLTETSDTGSSAGPDKEITRFSKEKSSRTGDQGVFLQPVGSRDSNPFHEPNPTSPITSEPGSPAASTPSESVSGETQSPSSGREE